MQRSVLPGRSGAEARGPAAGPVSSLLPRTWARTLKLPAMIAGVWEGRALGDHAGGS